MKVPVEYIPPASEAIEAIGKTVCQQLDVKEHEVVTGLTQFIKVVAEIKTRHLNREGQVDNDAE
jgi:hypothetical protein